MPSGVAQRLSVGQQRAGQCPQSQGINRQGFEVRKVLL